MWYIDGAIISVVADTVKADKQFKNNDTICEKLRRVIYEET